MERQRQRLSVFRIGITIASQLRLHLVYTSFTVSYTCTTFVYSFPLLRLRFGDPHPAPLGSGPISAVSGRALVLVSAPKLASNRGGFLGGAGH